jgi:HTTM domain
MTLASLAQAWNAFFHTPEPPATIAVFRILFGIVLTANALLLLREAPMWLSPKGVLSLEWHRTQFGNSRFSLLAYLPPTDAAVRLLLGLHLAAATLLTAGVFTRMSALVAFVTLMSIHHRNPMITHSGDSLLRLMTFLLIFSPAGEALSVDRMMAADSGPPALASQWCLRLMQLQISILYFRAFAGKLRGETWRDGTAVFYPVTLTEYRRFPLPTLLDNPAFLRAATWSTLAIEFALGPLVWIDELRYPVLACALVFHLSIEYAMNLQLFGWTMIACLVLFVDPYDVEWIVRGIGGAAAD